MKKYIRPLILVASTAATILIAWKFYKRKKFEVVIPEGKAPLTANDGETVKIGIRRAGSKVWQ